MSPNKKKNLFTDENMCVMGLVTLIDNSDAIDKKNPNKPVTALPIMNTRLSSPPTVNNSIAGAISSFKIIPGIKASAERRLPQYVNLMTELST